jgi:hypothetical protein
MAAPRVQITDLPEQTAPVATDLLVVQDGGVTKKMTVDKLTTAASTGLNAHITAASGAHIASAIAATPNGGTMNGADVQTQLAQASTALDARLGMLAALELRVTALEQR